MLRRDARWATTIGGQRRVVLVAVPTDLGASAIGPTVTFGVLGLIGIILILATVTTIAVVGQALRPVERMRRQIEGPRSGGPARCSRCLRAATN